MLLSYIPNLNLQLIQINSKWIYHTDSIKLLGNIIDKNLNFMKHITLTSSKLSKSVGLIHRLKHYLPEEIMKKTEIFINSFLLKLSRWVLARGISVSRHRSSCTAKKRPFWIWISMLILMNFLNKALFYNATNCKSLA